MKRILLLVLCSIFMTTGAWAYTWTDNIDFNPDKYVNLWQSFSYTHDLTDNTPVPFTVGQDLITDYSLTIRLRDDGGRWDFGEIAFIDQPGILGDGLYNFNYANDTFGWSLGGLLSLNLLGGLDVTVTSAYGDFYLDYSNLEANGCDVAPVPEPGTIMLLGAGFLGLAVYRKRRKNT